MRYRSIEEMIVASAEAVRPPDRITVSQAAERYHIVKNPGQHEGPFSLEKTPYLIEPMDVLTSLDYTGMAFVGPARTGKSAMFLNWLCHTALTDPTDIMLVHMAQHTAREWSQTDLDKMIRNSPEMKKRLAPGRQNDNVFDKRFLSGMRLSITWPTITNLSGKTVPKTWTMDLDRIDPNIDGEGDVWTLTKKRAQTFRRYGMSVAESSPGFPVIDAKWIQRSPHEAPPTGGILAIYNDGDRRRWYWRCSQCSHPFEADFKHLHWPADIAEPMEASEQTYMLCPSGNGCIMYPHEQRALNAGGRWLAEGETWLDDGTIVGTRRRSPIASFWLKGPAAAFTTWPELVYKYITAENEYERTGNEEKLKAVTNTDLGLPYTYKALEAGRLPEELKNRAEDWGGSADNPVVPEGVRFLVATVDVQKRSFVVQIHGVTPEGDIAIIAYYKIRKSNRIDNNGERHQIDPAAYLEDWDLIIPEVIERSFPLADGSGRRMQIKIIACDSGGREGVTTNAYNFWRKLRDGEEGHHRRFHLLKGAPSKSAPRLGLTWPDSGRKDRHANARGEIPVYLVNSDLVKDQVSSMLGRVEPGGRARFAAWFEDFMFTQLTTEIRTAKGWENPSKRRNEAWDLLVYAVAFTLHSSIRLEQLNWDSPPGWAAPWDQNDLVFAADVSRRFAGKKSTINLAKLADELG